MGALWSWIRGFWQQEMEMSIVGLQNAGKSTFIHVIQKGEYVPDMIPTVGFNMHKVDKGKVSIKVWDLGGQKKFRGMWERYCRKNDAIVLSQYISQIRIKLQTYNNIYTTQIHG